LGFETLTLVPFDLEAVDFDMLTEHDRVLLYDYHRKVYNTLSPFLNDEEKEWLYQACGMDGTIGT
jgi:Xaa-Pro aminopeptidase